jgi:hypothetical protein
MMPSSLSRTRAESRLNEHCAYGVAFDADHHPSLGIVMGTAYRTDPKSIQMSSLYRSLIAALTGSASRKPVCLFHQMEDCAAIQKGTEQPLPKDDEVQRYSLARS